MMKYVFIVTLVWMLGFSGCANYQNLVSWKNDRVGTEYAIVKNCEIKDNAYVGKAQICFGKDAGKDVEFYLKPYFKPTVPYSKDTILFVENK